MLKIGVYYDMRQNGSIKMKWCCAIGALENGRPWCGDKMLSFRCTLYLFITETISFTTVIWLYVTLRLMNKIICRYCCYRKRNLGSLISTTIAMCKSQIGNGLKTHQPSLFIPWVSEESTKKANSIIRRWNIWNILYAKPSSLCGI